MFDVPEYNILNVYINVLENDIFSDWHCGIYYLSSKKIFCAIKEENNY